MAAQFSTTFTREQLLTAFAGLQLDEDVLAQPDTVQLTAWLSRLHLLYGLPFNYLVPDIRMLPDESIRFFRVDQNWIEALMDGAMSLGSTVATAPLSAAAQPQLKQVAQRNLAAVRGTVLELDTAQLAPAEITGFFLRSAAVSGWPGLEVTGFSNAAGSLPLLRLERLSPSLLLCLFGGTVANVTLRQPAETLHFAFDYWGDREISEITDDYYTKVFRYINTNVYNGITYTTGQRSTGHVQVGFRPNQLSRRIVNISGLASSLSVNAWAPGTPEEDQYFTSAEFGLAMIQSTDEINFQVS